MCLPFSSWATVCNTYSMVLSCPHLCICRLYSRIRLSAGQMSGFVPWRLCVELCVTQQKAIHRGPICCPKSRKYRAQNVSYLVIRNHIFCLLSIMRPNCGCIRVSLRDANENTGMVTIRICIYETCSARSNFTISGG